MSLRNRVHVKASMAVLIHVGFISVAILYTHCNYIKSLLNSMLRHIL